MLLICAFSEWQRVRNICLFDFADAESLVFVSPHTGYRVKYGTTCTPSDGGTTFIVLWKPHPSIRPSCTISEYFSMFLVMFLSACVISLQLVLR
jgi:hypothetical protein